MRFGNRQRCGTAAFARGPIFALSAVVAVAVFALIFFASKRSAKTVPALRGVTLQIHRNENETPVETASLLPAHYGYVSWYAVPVDSLAHRRGAEDGLTAASDKLPLGTRVRITNPANHKTVTVRVTDRGIHNRHIQLDLSKNAASELEILRSGIARVQMEVLVTSGDAVPSASVPASP